VYHDFGQIELQKGSHSLGIMQLRMGLAMLEGHSRMPASAWRLYLQCAQFEYISGHPEKAIETCLSALENPFVSRSLLALGRLHEQLRHFHCTCASIRWLWIIFTKPWSISNRLATGSA
jgi:hypothetical protein